MLNNTKNQFEPDYAIHPGEILEETLQARGIGKTELAMRSGLTPKHISQIIHGKAPVTPETALSFERILDVKAGLWLKLDSDYRLFIQKKQEQAGLEAKFTWAQNFPLKELTARGFLPKTNDKPVVVAALLDFFNVGTIAAWEKQYADMVVQFRKTGKTRENAEAIAAWLKLGENQAKEISAAPYNKTAFERALTDILPLTNEDPKVFEPAMVDKCARSGVAVVFVKEFAGTGISGGTYWLSKEKAILMLSLRYKWDDHFWFTFYHEAGHIILHGKNQLTVDGSLIEDNPRENEANKFAADFLIPPKEYQTFIMQNPRISEALICEFAKQLGIAPGIVVGRLQKDGRLPFNWCNSLKRRFVLTNQE